MSLAGLERMTTRSVAKRLILSRHTGRCIYHPGFIQLYMYVRVQTNSYIFLRELQILKGIPRIKNSLLLDKIVFQYGLLALDF